MSVPVCPFENMVCLGKPNNLYNFKCCIKQSTFRKNWLVEKKLSFSQTSQQIKTVLRREYNLRGVYFTFYFFFQLIFSFLLFLQSFFFKFRACFHYESRIEQQFPNWAPRRPGAPRDLARDAPKTYESCCIYCFLYKNYNVKVVNSFLQFYSVR